MKATSEQNMTDEVSHIFTAQDSTPNTDETNNEHQETHIAEGASNNINEKEQLKISIIIINEAVQNLSTRLATLEASSTAVTRNDSLSYASAVSQPSITTTVNKLYDRLTALEKQYKKDISAQWPLPNQD